LLVIVTTVLMLLHSLWSISL